MSKIVALSRLIEVKETGQLAFLMLLFLSLACKSRKLWTRQYNFLSPEHDFK